ncbi:hypothetical protein [Streptomyces sp. 8L]|uniref:hypothetical protein n=1 Tax=Streptomyces sp. 8L TaxID=2877242 RepID=UPI001CD2EEB2|nr:hypothetical protein [Streptomyces sp. 8L]
MIRPTTELKPLTAHGVYGRRLFRHVERGQRREGGGKLASPVVHAHKGAVDPHVLRRPRQVEVRR